MQFYAETEWNRGTRGGKFSCLISGGERRVEGFRAFLRRFCVLTEEINILKILDAALCHCAIIYVALISGALGLLRAREYAAGCPIPYLNGYGGLETVATLGQL